MLRLQSGEVQFNHLVDGAGHRLTDAHLRSKLAERYPWINAVYRETSDFVHLSFRHLWTAIALVDDQSRSVSLQISGVDAKADETQYHEIVDAFLEASIMTSMTILAMFMLLHRREEVEKAHRGQHEADNPDLPTEPIGEVG
jgi:hypothetical protein